MRTRSFPWWTLLALAAVAALGWLGWQGLSPATEAPPPPLATATRGLLRITVLEAGSLEALKSTTVSSQVEGQAAIIYLVEEGTVLGPDDVRAGRVLVKLDASDLEERISKQLIDVQAARAAKVNAEASLSIQQQEDASKERQAALKVEFADLDLNRYVGGEVAARLEKARRDVLDGTSREEDLERALRSALEDPALKGEAQQRLRQLNSDISLAAEDLKRAQVKWEWSRRLLERDFVSRDEEDADRLALERRTIELERTRTAQAQYATYDFAKEVTRLLSERVEAEGELARVRERALAAQARAQAELASKREQESLQEARYVKYLAQREACVIKATQPGLVLYASSGGDNRWGNEERIREGVQVRERQPILTLPDLDQMGARVNIHESVVDKVRPGQRVTVTVDAMPEQPVGGSVESVKTLPNPADRWMNPDLKVYATLLRLDSVLPGMRPGMSVKAEILVAEEADVVQVPVQAVGGPAGRPSVWVWDGAQARERRVELGAGNDRFVAVASGLQAGERVLLAPPRAAPAPAAQEAGSGGPAAGERPGGAGKGRNGPRQGTPRPEAGDGSASAPAAR